MDKEHPPDPPPSYEEVSQWSQEDLSNENQQGKKVHFGSQLPASYQPYPAHQQSPYQYHPSQLQTNQPLHYHSIEGVNLSPSHPNYYSYTPHQRVIIEPPPPNHALLAWFTCLCCCWPIGIIAVIKSFDVNSSLQRGDIARAKDSSKKAKKFSLIALGCGIIFMLLWLIIWIFFARYLQSHSHFHYAHYL